MTETTSDIVLHLETEYAQKIRARMQATDSTELAEIRDRLIAASEKRIKMAEEWTALERGGHV